MSRIAYVNGQYVPYAQAGVHVEDRGFQFADGVYEVVAITDGGFVDLEGHLARLERSLDELRIERPMTRAALSVVLRETVRRNRVRNGSIYLQITRGAAKREFAFPAGIAPTVVAIARHLDWNKAAANAARGVPAITQPDIRWGRCDIKTVGLLPAALAKQAAKEAGAYEAWLVDEKGFVTEGSSSNAWIVTKENVLVTRAPTTEILSGITRAAVLELAKREGLKVEFRPFTVAEALAAKEAFVSSATSYVIPVVTLDGKPIGNGGPGVVASRLRGLYETHAANHSSDWQAPFISP
ncbi:MAG: D-amino-acid transaminase [Ferrovibrio sp.]|uniref:D-amino-acid transaminase n=1 Tax=Ferrovibrio sp. TaxID=1917215 RepID=UPI002607BB67|nr:D-amino-acid transaminase [Ferrovibrio sp.]MCW0232203.1 D-amino-acid transaminase [Ferrovibrio sp.]